MADITVRAEQTTTEFDEGAVFTTERTERIDKLIADGRLTIFEGDADAGFAPADTTGVDSEALRRQADVDDAQRLVAEAEERAANAKPADRAAAKLAVEAAKQQLADAQDDAASTSADTED